MDKAALEKLLSAYDWWMGFSTIAVAIGILGEYIAHFIFEKEKRSLSEKVFTIAFAILVLGGVVGEYVFGSRLSAVSSELQRASDKEVAELNREAGEARKSAGEAMERAAHLEKQAEDERVARLKIEERMAPRKIDPRRLIAIRERLSAFKGYRADIGAVPGTFEGMQFASRLQLLLINAQWSANFMQAEAEGPLGGVVLGVMVKSTSDPRSIAAAKAVVEILKEEKIDAFFRTGLPGPFPNSPQDDPAIFRVLIVVGNKP